MKKILMVDDEEMILELLSSHLEFSGRHPYSVVVSLYASCCHAAVCIGNSYGYSPVFARLVKRTIADFVYGKLYSVSSNVSDYSGLWICQMVFCGTGIRGI